MAKLKNSLRLDLKLLLALVGFVEAKGLNAQGVVPAGAENKARGIESPMSSRRGSAVLYNPANIALVPEVDHPYAEVGILSRTFTYEHPTRDQVANNYTSPTISLGYVYKLTEELYVGGSFFPEEFSPNRIQSMPQDLGGQVLDVELNNRRQRFHTGAAVAYKASPRFQIGLSLLHTSDKQSVEAKLADSEANIMNTNVSAQYFRPRLGSHFSVGKLQGVFTYMPEQRLEYGGKTVTSFGLDDQSNGIARFEPAVYASGLGMRLKRFSAQVDVNYRRWASGRHFLQRSVRTDEAVDLNDVVERGVSVAYRFDKHMKASAGVAMLPSPYGKNYLGDSPETQIIGLNMQNYGAFDRINVGTGFSYLLGEERKQSVEISFLHSEGTREVAPGGSNPGFYQLEMNVVSASVSAEF